MISESAIPKMLLHPYLLLSESRVTNLQPDLKLSQSSMDSPHKRLPDAAEAAEFAIKSHRTSKKTVFIAAGGLPMPAERQDCRQVSASQAGKCRKAVRSANKGFNKRFACLEDKVWP